MTSTVLYGSKTIHLHQIWTRRHGSASTAPLSTLQVLFNDLDLYPSQSQICEMIHCAREECQLEVGRGTDHNEFLTFGEFCFFATELKRCYNYYKGNGRGICQFRRESGGGAGGGSADGSAGCNGSRSTKLKTQKSSASAYDVFLGGSCNPTTWRQVRFYYTWSFLTHYNQLNSDFVSNNRLLSFNRLLNFNRRIYIFMFN